MPFASNLYFYSYQPDETRTPPVVFLHGAGGSHLHWPSEVRRLPGHRILAPDLPGHGKSEGRGQQTIASYAQVVLDWLASLGLYQAVFIGHSMGAAIVLELALYHSSHVVGLGLIGAGARFDPPVEIMSLAAQTAIYASAIDSIVRQSFSVHANDRLVQLAALRMAETRPSVLFGDFMAAASFNAADEVDKINEPTLILCGVEDRITPLRNSQFLAGAIPDSRLVIVPQAGHMVMLEQPQATAEAVGKFLAEIPL